jgi:hypothetical protein
MRHDCITTSLSQSQSISIEPVHLHGVAEDEAVDSPEAKPHKPLNRDISPLAQDKQISHTSYAINVAIQAITPGTVQRGRLLGPPQQT